jgi:hypothetical protein
MIARMCPNGNVRSLLTNTREYVTTIRTFETGATRDSLGDKLQYEGYFSPIVLEARARYMRTHQTMADGSLRAPDNWQKGIPKDALMDSGFRHFMDWWMVHRGHGSREGVVAALCGLMFNAEAYLHAVLSESAELPLGVQGTFTASFGGAPQVLVGSERIAPLSHATDSDGGLSLSVAGSDEPYPLPNFGPGSPAATTADGGKRCYVGEDVSTTVAHV